MAGESVKKSEVDSLMDKIKECRAKWGGSDSTFSPTAGVTTVNAIDMNNLIDWVAEVNSRSGAGQSLPSKVARSQILTNIIPTLYSKTENIKNHCSCNCNHCSCNCNNCSCNHRGCGDGNNA